MEEQYVKKCGRMGFRQQQQGSTSRRSEVGSMPLQEGEDLGLPYHLLCRILASLPMLILSQLRLVCKSWNSLLQSPAFLEARAMEEKVASTDCWLVMGRKLPAKCAKEFIAYCPLLRKWFPLPLHSPSISSSLGHCSVRVASLRSWEVYDCGTGDSHLGSFLMAGAEGLVCCVVNGVLQEEEVAVSCSKFYTPDALVSKLVFDPSDYTVLVLHPLTGAVKRLPPPPKHYYIYNDTQFLSISMVGNPTAADSYHVALHDTRSYDHMEIYDSRSCSWKIGQPIAAAKFTGDVLNADLFSYDCEQELLFAYTAEVNEWSKIRVHCPWPRPTVLKCKGRLLLVSSVEDLLDIKQHFRVWELQTSSYGAASCIELAETPLEYRHKIHDCCDMAENEVKFITNGTLICMTWVHYTDFAYERRFYPPLVYDLDLGCWYHLPLYRDSFEFQGLFSFRPRLLP